MLQYKMTEFEQKIDNYELGFHLLPELEETETKAKSQEIETLISQLGGSVLGIREPKKQRLSYPLKQKRFSFFGVINFKSPAQAIEQLTAQLKLNNSLLRFIILKVKEEQKVLRSPKETQRTRTRTYTPPVREQKPKEEIKPEIIEKQIEEVIENL